jgi:hypothetical protein
MTSSQRKVINRFHGPIGSPRSNSPAALVWCDLRLGCARHYAPRGFKPAELTIEAAVSGFRRYRIIAADLEDKPFCNQRHAERLRRDTGASTAASLHQQRDIASRAGAKGDPTHAQTRVSV